MAAPPKPAPKKRRDLGRAVAVVLCALFAIVGAVPLLLGVLVRTSFVRGWAARETSALLQRELGVTARYQVEVEAWPMMIALSNVTVDANDGGLPFLRVERVAARPRPFSLLAGELDVGEVEVDRPWIRAVLKDGEIANLSYKLPPKGKEGASELPFTSLAITEGRVDVTVVKSGAPTDLGVPGPPDVTHALAEELDVDVSAEEGGAIEAGLRAGGATITRVHPTPDHPEEDAIDEDRLCKIEVRARIEGDDILVRRLAIAGSVDFDPDGGTIPACALAQGDWRALDVSLSALRISGLSQGKPRASGRVRAKVPLALAHRFVKAPHLTGSATLDVEAEYDGDGLPIVTGTLAALSPGADGKLFAETLEAKLNVSDTAVRLSDINAIWGSGKVTIAEAKVEPFAKGRPLTAGPVVVTGMDFPDLIRDLGVHPQAIVGWKLKEVHLPEFKGTLDPLDLSGPLSGHTEDFQVYDRSVRRQDKHRMVGLPEANLHGTFVIKPEGVTFQGFSVDVPGGRTHIATTCTIEFKNRIALDVNEGTKIDLAEISPLAEIPIAGLASVKLAMHAPLSHPFLTADVAIQDFVFAGLPVGQIEQAKAEFEPLKLILTDVRGRKNTSAFHASRARIAFDEGARVIVDADVDTRAEPHMEVHDLLDIFNMDKTTYQGRTLADPRWSEIHGRGIGAAHVHFVSGGREDRCGQGFLKVDGDFHFPKVELYGETYDGGDVDVGLVWDDRRAGANGMKLDVRSAILRKGPGSITATAVIRHGGVLRAQALASGVPIGSLDVLGQWGKKFDGTISAVAKIGGRLDAMNGLVDVEVSRVRVGPATLDPSHFALEIVPKQTAAQKPAASASAAPVDVEAAELARAQQSGCDNSAGAPFDYGVFASDPSWGDYVVNGSLFGDQIAMKDVKVSQQKRKDVRGAIDLKDLDLGVLANLVPGVAFSASPPSGRLSAAIDVKHVFLLDLPRSDVTLAISKLQLARGGQNVKLLSQSGPITLTGNVLDLPGLRLEGRASSGLSGVLFASGKVDRVLTAPSLDVKIGVEPMSLSKISADIPGVERASGVVEATLRMQGKLDGIQYSGSAKLKNGELAVKGLPVALTDVQVEVDIGGGDLRFKKASAKVGTGTITLTGGVPIHGTELGAVDARIKAEGVKLPIADGVVLTTNADLKVAMSPTSEDPEQRMPKVTGDVRLTSFSYTRPIELAVNLGQLGSRTRTTVETYDPKNDSLRFDLNVTSAGPLRFANNLIDMQLEVVEPGLALSGTNQRYGARGLLKILPQSKLRLRDHDFEVKEGSVRFEDPNRVTPKVDVRAQTEYRRGTALTESSAAAPTTTASSGATGSGAANLWRITMHAYGNADALKVDLSSDPALRQEDIVLLLTLGVTRAEMEQGLASSVGDTVAPVGLEALSTLTGADKAVKTIVPIIDEFRFGTAYSVRLGRTQPMVTVGKRITDSVRATVTTGVTENRDVKATIEWKLNRGVSVQGSYDNSSDTFGLPIGNLGADLRWRIDFE
ncbi:MAG: translocation/assembly module TamB domain-containing protein [Polyangiaceae bacterium]